VVFLRGMVSLHSFVANVCRKRVFGNNERIG
jgi:hypothetical protein